jgi:predicted dehydrogenase
MSTKSKVGIVGCGNISGIYLKNLPTFKNLEVTAVADLDLDRAKAKAEEFGVSRAFSVQEILASDVDVIVNLTIPAAHSEIALAALGAGKHVYNEKPLSIELEDARAMLELAKSKNLRVGCAPDTFLGAGLQTARAVLDAGTIGQAVGAHAMMVYPGPERWHPDPEFFFKRGAGPLFDMGPYYITALVHLFGAVKRVTANARITHATRTIGSGAKKGQQITVETPTYIAGVLEFSAGMLANLTMSFDALQGSAPNIEIMGSEGALLVNDPNMFTGLLQTRDTNYDWHDVAISRPYSENSRGLGVADMMKAHSESRAHRANGELAFHALEVMHGILIAAQESRFVEIVSQPAQPAPLGENETF